MNKYEMLRSLGANYVIEPRRPDDIDMYEAAEEWGISPKAAEWRLNKEVAEGRMVSVIVRSALNRQIRVWREAKPPAPPALKRDRRASRSQDAIGNG